MPSQEKRAEIRRQVASALFVRLYMKLGAAKEDGHVYDTKTLADEAIDAAHVFVQQIVEDDK